MRSYRSHAQNSDRLSGKQRWIDHVQDHWQLYRFAPAAGWETIYWLMMEMDVMQWGILSLIFVIAGFMARAPSSN
ncbi:MAG: hypothetical protein R3C56_27705 [Pirellulaceae bacterium]